MSFYTQLSAEEGVVVSPTLSDNSMHAQALLPPGRPPSCPPALDTEAARDGLPDPAPGSSGTANGLPVLQPAAPTTSAGASSPAADKVQSFHRMQQVNALLQRLLAEPGLLKTRPLLAHVLASPTILPELVEGLQQPGNTAVLMLAIQKPDLLDNMDLLSHLLGGRQRLAQLLAAEPGRGWGHPEDVRQGKDQPACSNGQKPRQQQQQRDGMDGDQELDVLAELARLQQPQQQHHHHHHNHHQQQQQHRNAHGRQDQASSGSSLSALAPSLQLPMEMPPLFSNNKVTAAPKVVVGPVPRGNMTGGRWTPPEVSRVPRDLSPSAVLAQLQAQAAPSCYDQPPAVNTGAQGLQNGYSAHPGAHSNAAQLQGRWAGGSSTAAAAAAAGVDAGQRPAYQGAEAVQQQQQHGMALNGPLSRPTAVQSVSLDGTQQHRVPPGSDTGNQPPVHPPVPPPPDLSGPWLALQTASVAAQMSAAQRSTHSV